MYFSDRAIETRTWAEAEEGHRRDQQDGLTARVGSPTGMQQTQPGRRTILAFTGHRPQRMGGFNPDNPTARWVRAQLADAIGRAIRAGFRTLPLLPAGRWDSTTGPPAPSLISSSS